MNILKLKVAVLTIGTLLVSCGSNKALEIDSPTSVESRNGQADVASAPVSNEANVPANADNGNPSPTPTSNSNPPSSPSTPTPTPLPPVSSDTTPPPSLSAFSVSPGTQAGQSKLVMTYPTDTSDYSKVDIRRALGSTPPSALCNDGTVVVSSTSNFPVEFIDITGILLPSLFSYRVCVYDAAGNVNSSGVGSGMSFGGNPPAALDALDGSDGSWRGEIDLVLDFPSRTSDYAKIELRRVPGAVAPSEDCTSGTLVRTITSDFNFRMFITDRTGSTNASAFSYRACIFGEDGSLTSSNIEQNVKAQLNCYLGGFRVLCN